MLVEVCMNVRDVFEIFVTGYLKVDAFCPYIKVELRELAVARCISKKPNLRNMKRRCYISAQKLHFMLLRGPRDVADQ